MALSTIQRAIDAVASGSAGDVAPDPKILIMKWLMGFLWVQMGSSRGGSVVRFLRIWLGLLWRRKGKQQQRVLLCGACLWVLSGNGTAAVRRMAGRNFEKNLELIALNEDDVERGDEDWGSTKILTEEDMVLKDGVLAVGSAVRCGSVTVEEIGDKEGEKRVDLWVGLLLQGSGSNGN
ncbi:hypothetical protein F0562_025668 [Nyssa sinensis]|uniref:Uncharacterized protein n=1 Tax=Nyssa sinensis TaxID=561372 RepID=A0A5J5B9C7_9ASTE|nr:hypothetical protein F0562_025668 [Nyssa sinensis]